MGRPGQERTSRARVVRRLLVVLVVVFGLFGMSAAPAAALNIPNPLPNIPVPHISVPNPLDACNNLDAPTPASPYGDGSWIVRLSSVDVVARGGRSVNGEAGSSTGDPFDNPDSVSLESTYGSTPQWWTYDNGCTGRFVAGAGTSLGNILLDVSGALPNWSQALLDSVIGPDSWMSALDKPVVNATKSVTAGVWAPWVGIVLLLVACVVLLRSRAGRLAGAVTAFSWAMIVLVASTWLINYPQESVKLVDSGVQQATGLIASGFDGDGNAPPGSQCTSVIAEHGGCPTGQTMSATQAQAAVDRQMDQVVRMTQYRTWLAGVFGDADSKTAKKYGPDVFRATHFSWTEYDTYKDDPSGKGKKILQAKQASFKKLAGEIKKNDPVAYSYFKGEHWSQRISLGVVNLATVVVVVAFLLAAGLAILLAFTLIRMLVPFAPAAGVLFMLDQARDAAISVLKKVAGPLVMGPIYFVVALILLRFDAAILTSGVWFILKIALIAGLSFLAWRLTRPAAYGIKIPGLGRLTQLLTTYVAAKGGGAAGAREALAGNAEQSSEGEEEATRKRTVYMPEVASLPQPSRDTDRALPAGSAGAVPPRYRFGEGVDAAGPRRKPASTIRVEQVRDGQDSGEQTRDQAQGATGAWFDGTSQTRAGVYRPAISGVYRGAEELPALEAPAGAGAASAEPATAYEAPDDVAAGVRPPAAGVHDEPSINTANVEYDAEGRPVFVIYTPTGNQALPVDDEQRWPGGTQHGDNGEVA